MKFVVDFTLEEAITLNNNLSISIIQHEKVGASATGRGSSSTKSSKFTASHFGTSTKDLEISCLVHISQATIDAGERYFT